MNQTKLEKYGAAVLSQMNLNIETSFTKKYSNNATQPPDSKMIIWLSNTEFKIQSSSCSTLCLKIDKYHQIPFFQETITLNIKPKLQTRWQITTHG